MSFVPEILVVTPESPEPSPPSAPSPATQVGSRTAAYLESSVAAFLAVDDAVAFAALTHPRGFTLTPEQLRAWLKQIPALRDALRGLDGWIYLEFDIPRLGRRVDAVLVTTEAVVPIEFKVGETDFHRADFDQAWDYALDLKNFHAPSHGARIFPILCATEAIRPDTRWKRPAPDGVAPPFRCNSATLANAIRMALTSAARSTRSDPAHADLNAADWGKGDYSPTPTIIEAARTLYARHTVHEITRNDAGARNLSVTAGRVEAIIADSMARGRKALILLTGVPGAGKTLVGLNVATRHGVADRADHAVLLSGNGPLVSVLREALARDERDRRAALGERVRIGECRTKVQAFIQRVHHFRDDTFRSVAPPSDRVVVFDEAQRAWNSQMLANFMKRKRNTPGVTQSEPEVLLAAMDRHAGWAAVLCLVGGGQEINTGEAGIGAWLDAVRNSFPGWDVYMSPNLSDSEYSARQSIQDLVASRTGNSRVTTDVDLHLSVSMRSFRAESLSHFVKALLDGDVDLAQRLHGALKARFPIRVTRSMRTARAWIRRQRRGSERAGVLASSSALRLKPHAIDVRVEADPVHWFLGPPQDTRSSHYLEDAATEFQVQGLELDWTIVAWDADLRRTASGWNFHSFRGAAWTSVAKEERKRYLANAYRVLLTRARQGMVIFVPIGRLRDRTRKPEYYTGVYEYLRSAGLEEI